MSTPLPESDAWARRAANLMAAHLAKASVEHDRRPAPAADRFGDDRPDRMRLRRTQEILRAQSRRPAAH